MKPLRIDTAGWRGWRTQTLAWAASCALLAGCACAEAAAPAFPPEAQAASIRLLQSGDSVDGLREVTRLGALGAPALPVLFIAMTNRDALVSSMAWRAVERTRLPDDPFVTGALLQHLDDAKNPRDVSRSLELVRPVLERLYAAEPTNDAICLQLGIVCYGLIRTGVWQKETNQLERAADLLGAVYHNRGPLAASAAMPFAAIEEDLGGVCFRADRHKAGKAYESARGVWVELMAGSPNYLYLRRFLVLSAKMADCFWYEGRKTEAVSNYRAVDAMLMAMTNRDDIWWEPAALLVAADDVRSSQCLAEADYRAAGEALARARAKVERRLATCPDSRVAIPLSFVLGLRSADLCVLEDRASQAEAFLAKSEEGLLSAGAKNIFDSRARGQMRELVRRFRTALARLDAGTSWHAQDPVVVAAVLHALGEIAMESGRPAVAYAYARDALLLRVSLADKDGRGYQIDLLVDTGNMALVAEALGKPVEAMTLASNALEQADALLASATRKERDVLQGRARALAMLARLNEAAGVAAQAQQFQDQADAAAEACRRSGFLREDPARVYLQDIATPVWQEPWAASAGATLDLTERGEALGAHWGKGLWMQATPSCEGGQP